MVRKWWIDNREASACHLHLYNPSPNIQVSHSFLGRTVSLCLELYWSNLSTSKFETAQIKALEHHGCRTHPVCLFTTATTATLFLSQKIFSFIAVPPVSLRCLFFVTRQAYIEIDEMKESGNWSLASSSTEYLLLLILKENKKGSIFIPCWLCVIFCV